MPKLTTDFNVSPYYDDFDEAKKFFKILYRPSFSVQARELTQMQSILQNQIEQLGDYNFSDGDKVYGGEVSINTKINSLKLKTNYASVEIIVSNFEGRIIEGNTSGARASVVKAEKFTQTTLNTLMITYLDEKTFVDDEIIQTIDTGTTYFANVAGEDEGLTGVTTLTTSISSQPGSIVSIDEGVFYVGGFFVYVSPQTLVLDLYKNAPTYRIGLSIVESIVTSVDDTDLLDNSIGSPNYTAPGANRYKVDLQLAKKNIFESGTPIVSSGLTFTASSNTATITTSTDHNLNNGDIVVISGATQSEYNGRFPIANVTSGTTFTVYVAGKPVTPATGTPVYTKVITDPLEARSDENFIELTRVENGIVTKQIVSPLYGAIGDVLARRTFDQSGDFTVKPFSIAFETHKIAGVASARTSANACTNFTGTGTGFVSQLVDGDTIFLSGNTNKTATIDSIANNTSLTLTSGTTLGDGSDNQKIGVDTKITAALSPGKAYVKGYEYETVTTTFIDVDKGRDTRTVSGEQQGTDFGPFLKVTDVHAKTGFDVSVDTASMGTGSGASGMDLIELHCVKWPSTYFVGGTTDPTRPMLKTPDDIDASSNNNIDFIAINPSDGANTKIGTARIRQLDYRGGRDSSIDSLYYDTVPAAGTEANTHHRVFPGIYDAHLFDFRFEKVTGTVGAANANTSVVRLALSIGGGGSQPTKIFPNANTLYGVEVTVNTSFLGVTTSDTRKIISWTGNETVLSPSTTYTAVLDSPLSQPTTTTSTYSIDFSIKNVRSGVKIDTSQGQEKNKVSDAFNIDPSGRIGGVETGDTILYKSNDDERSLIFPLQNSTVANLNPTGSSSTTYRFKRTFSVTLNSTAGGTATAPSGEAFYPATTKTLSAAEADANYIVTALVGDHEGRVIEFSNTSGSSLHAGSSHTRAIELENSGGTLVVKARSDATGAPDLASHQVQVIATMQRTNATNSGAGSQISKKILVSGNTTVANVDHNTSNRIQADTGQIVFGTSMNVQPGANNSLKISDVKKLVAVIDSLNPDANVKTSMVTASIADTANQHNITSRFEFDTGQKDNYYDYGKISLKPGEDKPVGQVIAIVDYYTHSGSGPFTVDSYIFNGSGNTPYTEIPSYTSSVSGNKFQLRDVIDFRPARIGIETANTDLASYTNDIKATANVFHGKILPDFDYTFDTDYAHYLPRKDKIVLTRDRNFKVIKGVSDINPVLPADDEDSMTLYTMEVPAYTFNPNDVQARYIDNKRFTMKDIGTLEKRIENLEYYVSLNLLEKEADGLTITDVNDNDRFKNGILVDPFAGHSIGDVFNSDFNASIDYENKHLRPPFNSDLHRLEFDANTQNSTLVNNGGILTLPFSSSPFLDQPMTGNLLGKNTQRTLSVNPYSYQNYIGTCDLDPPTDNWYDKNLRPQVVVNLEGQYDNWQDMVTSNAHGSHYNDWEEIWSGVQIIDDVKKGTRDAGDSASNDRRAKTTTQNKTRSGLKKGKVPEKILKTIGNKVVNISVLPKLREQTITFVAKGLKPNKNVYAFFDDTKVTSFVKQATLIGLSNVSTSNVFRTTSSNFETIRITGSGGNAGNTAKVVYMSDRNDVNACSIMIINQSTEGAFTIGSVLQGIDTLANGTISSVQNYSLSDGQILVNNEGVTAGQFNVPSSTFTSGELVFRLTDDSDNILGTTTSVAERIFHNKGVIDSNREDNVISVRPLIKKRDDITTENIVKSYATPRRSESNKFFAPMAQSFFVSEDNYPSGVFLDSIELYFHQKESSIGSKNSITLELRPMIDGAPSPSVVIPGSQVTLSPGRVTANTSTPVANNTGGFPAASLGNSLTANKQGNDVGSRTIFKFDFPVFLSAGEYAFTLNSSTSEYKLYSYELGAKHTGTERKITKQPYVGKLFKPSNAESREGLANEGLMFKINRCNFSSDFAHARLTNFATSSSNATSNSIMDTMKVVCDVLEFANTSSIFHYYTTAKNASSKGTATQFVPNKNIELKTQQQVTYESDVLVDAYANSFQLNVYFTSANTIISPVFDETRAGVISIENDVNNAGIKNSNILIISSGSSLLQSEYGGDTGRYASPNAVDGNTSAFTVSAPDIGSNTATIAANVGSDGKLNDIKVVNPGSGYLTNPTVTVASALSGTDPVIRIVGEGSNASSMLTANTQHSRGGNITAKYISRRVTLEEGFDASDLRVYMNAYKPRGSNIHVYYKVMSNEDAENFDDKPYILMDQDTSAGLFSLNEDDFKEYVFKTKDEKISYSSNDGVTTFRNFRTFCIKIVFTRDLDIQTTYIGIPKVSDLKAIALDSPGNP